MHPVERYRKAQGWTQVDLAKHLGVSANSVRAWEAGAEPRPSRLSKLAEVLRVDRLQLLDEIVAWKESNVRGAKEESRRAA